MEEIAEEMLCSVEPVESEEDEIEEKIVPIEEAQRAWSTVRKFLQQRSGKPGVMQACDRLDNEMYEIRRKNMRQPTILESFGLTVSMTGALMCFRCGKYTPDGKMGSVIPCYDYNNTDLKECRHRSSYCLKYVNKGIIIRDCVQECESGVHELSEFYCCQEDGCNGSYSVKMGWTVWFLFVLSLLTPCMT